MEALANMMVATLDLFEAEGRTFRRQFLRLLMAGILVFMGALLVLLGIGFLIFGAFQMLSHQINPPAAASIMGVVALLLAGAVTWTARRMI